MVGHGKAWYGMEDQRQERMSNPVVIQSRNLPLPTKNPSATIALILSPFYPLSSSSSACILIPSPQLSFFPTCRRRAKRMRTLRPDRRTSQRLPSARLRPTAHGSRPTAQGSRLTDPSSDGVIIFDFFQASSRKKKKYYTSPAGVCTLYEDLFTQ